MFLSEEGGTQQDSFKPCCMQGQERKARNFKWFQDKALAFLTVV